MTRKLKPAVFLDRDGTVIEQVHYLNDPDDVKLIDGVADSILRLTRAGYLTVIATNQAAIAHGLLTIEILADIHAEMNRQLREIQAEISGIYFCPLARVGNDREAIEDPYRKPGPGMLLHAADELGIDLSRSWMVGDMISDILAGKNAGCVSNILVKTGYGASQPHDHPAIDYIAEDLSDAVDLILGSP